MAEDVVDETGRGLRALFKAYLEVARLLAKLLALLLGRALDLEQRHRWNEARSLRNNFEQRRDSAFKKVEQEAQKPGWPGSATPEELGEVLVRTEAWYEYDPRMNIYRERTREEILERFGIDVAEDFPQTAEEMAELEETARRTELDDVFPEERSDAEDVTDAEVEVEDEAPEIEIPETDELDAAPAPEIEIPETDELDAAPAPETQTTDEDRAADQNLPELATRSADGPQNAEGARATDPEDRPQWRIVNAEEWRIKRLQVAESSGVETELIKVVRLSSLSQGRPTSEASRPGAADSQPSASANRRGPLADQENPGRRR